MTQEFRIGVAGQPFDPPPGSKFYVWKSGKQTKDTKELRGNPDHPRNP
jgi:hypothetical protein